MNLFQVSYWSYFLSIGHTSCLFHTFLGSPVLVTQQQSYFLHKMVQSHLCTDGSSLKDLFYILHHFCLSLQLDRLHAQVNDYTHPCVELYTHTHRTVHTHTELYTHPCVLCRTVHTSMCIAVSYQCVELYIIMFLYTLHGIYTL